MTEKKICPFMSNSSRLDLSALGDDGQSIVMRSQTGTAAAPCIREKCMAWYESGQRCNLIPEGGQR